MISGVLYALLAGLMWGLIFVGPLIVPEYPAILQSTGRYLALGLIAVPLAWLGRARLRQLGRQDWLTALGLSDSSAAARAKDSCRAATSKVYIFDSCQPFNSRFLPSFASVITIPTRNFCVQHTAQE